MKEGISGPNKTLVSSIILRSSILMKNLVPIPLLI